MQPPRRMGIYMSWKRIVVAYVHFSYLLGHDLGFVIPNQE